MNATLIDYLSRPDVVQQLINYVIVAPSNNEQAVDEAKEPNKYVCNLVCLYACGLRCPPVSSPLFLTIFFY